MKNSNKSLTKIAVGTLLIALGAQANLASAKDTGSDKGKAKAPQQSQLVSKLTKNSWRLTSVKNKTGRELLKFKFVKRPAQLAFRQVDKSVGFTFSMGCNTFASALTVQGNTIQPNMMTATKIHCFGMDRIEKEFSNVMKGKSTVSVSKDGRQLVQKAKNGYKLVWKANK